MAGIHKSAEEHPGDGGIGGFLWRNYVVIFGFDAIMS
jgi:hypothetical protein